jgi:hypothetical protein
LFIGEDRVDIGAQFAGVALLCDVRALDLRLGRRSPDRLFIEKA